MSRFRLGSFAAGIIAGLAVAPWLSPLAQILVGFACLAYACLDDYRAIRLARAEGKGET